MDRLNKEQRHKNMAAIHSKNTKPEILVRKFLFSRGFRYRLTTIGCPGNLILYCANIKRVFLSTNVSGMGMMDANIL